MEYLPGVSLAELVIRDGALPPARVVHILRNVCASLAEAHNKGMIHRDIKPANIMLCELGGQYDVVKVLDFGLVQSISSGDLNRRAIRPDRYASLHRTRKHSSIGNSRRSNRRLLGRHGRFLLVDRRALV